MFYDLIRLIRRCSKQGVKCCRKEHELPVSPPTGDWLLFVLLIMPGVEEKEVTDMPGALKINTALTAMVQGQSLHGHHKSHLLFEARVAKTGVILGRALGLDDSDPEAAAAVASTWLRLSFQ